MNITYDRIADAVYVNVAAGAVAKTMQLSDLLNVDVDTDGNVVGIELLEASAQDELVKGLEHNVEHGVPVSISSETPALGTSTV